MVNGTVAAVTPAPSTSGTTHVSGGTTTGLFAGNYQTLQYGSRGTRVTTLQNALNQDSYSYSIYNSINTYTYNYKLRGRELLFTITMTL